MASIVGCSVMMGGYFITAQEQLVGRAYLLFLGIIKANCIHFSSFKLVGQEIRRDW